MSAHGVSRLCIEKRYKVRKVIFMMNQLPNEGVQQQHFCGHDIYRYPQDSYKAEWAGNPAALAYNSIPPPRLARQSALLHIGSDRFCERVLLIQGKEKECELGYELVTRQKDKALVQFYSN